jgi:DNA-binding transcriptional LysR family regulator
LGKAAANLRVSQPAVSQLITDLEHAVGTKLFDRNSRGVTLTKYGRALLARGQAAFDELKQGIKEIEFLSDPTAGELKVGCQEAIAAFLSPVVQSFYQKYPNILLDVYEEEFDRFAARLRDRTLDFVLQRLRNPVWTSNPFFDDLNVEVLFNDQLMISTGTKSRWADRRKIDLAELADEPWILSPPDTWNFRIVTEAFRTIGMGPPRIALKTLSTHLRANMAASGKFLAPFPHSVLRFYAERFSLKPLPVTLPKRPWPVAILTLKNRTLNPAVQLFISHLRHSITAGGAS